MASTLVVIEYDDQYKAEETRLKLQKMQKEYLIDLEDAVVAVKDEKGKIKLHQAINLTAHGAASGGFWSALVGLIFLNSLNTRIRLLVHQLETLKQMLINRFAVAGATTESPARVVALARSGS